MSTISGIVALKGMNIWIKKTNEVRMGQKFENSGFCGLNNALILYKH